MRKWNLGLALLLALAGCRGLGLKDESGSELERNLQDSDTQGPGDPDPVEPG